MDEMNEQSMPALEETIEECCEGFTEAECCRPRRRGVFAGLVSGAIVGGGLALLLAPLRGERSIPAGHWQSREGIEQEGALRARIAAERAQSALGGILTGVKGAWNAVRVRLRDAAEEAKEGMAEGQAEARMRYEVMTKRRGRRR